jgi:hypothetical protein
MQLTEDLMTISDKLRLSKDGFDAPVGIVFKYFDSLITVNRLGVLK